MSSEERRAPPTTPTSAPVEDVGGLPCSPLQRAQAVATMLMANLRLARGETGVKGWRSDYVAREYAALMGLNLDGPANLTATDLAVYAYPEQGDDSKRRAFESGFLAALSPSLIQPQADLTIGQEPKYRFEGGRIINRASGEAIPLDEPVMIFRARDRNAAEMIELYRGLCKDYEHRCIVARRVDDFVAFAKAHPDRMKEPDTALIQPQGEERS